jgi:6-phosphofructokinase
MRLGILTGGGDCPGLNALIRAAVVRTIRTYQSQMVGFEDGWLGLFKSRARDLDLPAIKGILPRGGTILGTSRTDPLREEGGVQAIKDALALHELDGLLVCGGDGTLSAAARLWDEGVPIIGVPKTIDNDVPETDFAFGFDTALRHVVDAVDALHTTAESHDRVIVLEVMGRSAGWIAVCGGVAGGADVVVAPEHPTSVHEVCNYIRHRQARGRLFSIVVVAEGARFEPDPDGKTLEVPVHLDSFGRPRYGGVTETRTVILGFVQRGGTPTPFDRLLGSRMWVAAVDLAVKGEYGRMVSLQGGSITSVDLNVVRQGPRPVPAELFETARVFFG